MTILEQKLIDSYTVLVMAKEIELAEVPDTVLTAGKTLRYEVQLEEARRTVGTIPTPVDNNIVARLEELEQAIDTMLEEGVE